MWWHMLHRGGAPSTNVRGAMEKLTAVWYYFVPSGMSLPNLQVTPPGNIQVQVSGPGATLRKSDIKLAT
eukprot:1980336-Rhodomonas_salina.1